MYYSPFLFCFFFSLCVQTEIASLPSRPTLSNLLVLAQALEPSVVFPSIFTHQAGVTFLSPHGRVHQHSPSASLYSVEFGRGPREQTDPQGVCGKHSKLQELQQLSPCNLILGSSLLLQTLKSIAWPVMEASLSLAHNLPLLTSALLLSDN